MKGSIGLRRKITAFDRATNLTFSCCVYKEKIVKKRLMLIQIEKIATFNSDRKKNQFNSKEIIQILPPIIIDHFLTHSFIVDIS